VNRSPSAFFILGGKRCLNDCIGTLCEGRSYFNAEKDGNNLRDTVKSVGKFFFAF
jgi:hypothetical protein